MKTFLFCSLYYRNLLSTGANKRFENFIFNFHDSMGDNDNIIVVVKKNHIPDCFKKINKVSFIEVPFFPLFDRLFSYIYLSIIFSRISNSIVVSDFMPIPNRALSRHIHYQLIHDIRNFTDYKRSSYFNTAHKFQMMQWKKSNKIMTVSEFTKNELINKCGIKADNIFVSPNGLEKMYYNLESSLERDIDISYVATFEKRKNHRYLFEALLKYSGTRKIKLCLVGKDLGTLDEIKRLSLKLKNIDTVFIDSINSEKDMMKLYDRTNIFIFPSLYEGFGMPLIEAISRGCKVICSDIKVFKEIAGDFPRYFGLHDKPEYLMKIIEDELSIDASQNIINKSFLDKYKWSYIAKQFHSHIKHNIND